MKRTYSRDTCQRLSRRNQSLKTLDGWFRCDFSKKLISAIISGFPVWTTYGFDAKNVCACVCSCFDQQKRCWSRSVASVSFQCFGLVNTACIKCSCIALTKKFSTCAGIFFKQIGCQAAPWIHHETHLSTFKSQTRPHPWVSDAHENTGWSCCHRRTSCQRP